MAATILLADHTGRLGNRLILYAHVIAAAEEYGCRVINLSILPAAHFFHGLHRNPLGTYPRLVWPLDLRWFFRAFRQPIQNWVLRRRRRPPPPNRWLTVLDMENKPIYRLDSPEFARLTRSTRCIILWGFSFRSGTLLQKHAAKIRTFFRFRGDLAPRAAEWLAGCRRVGRKALCVHIRLDDVVNESWRYVPPETYARAVRNFQENRPGEAWEVFVCSDGRVPKDLFPAEAVIGIPRPLLEDYGLMTGADAVMGFDSTLSIFAAFASKSVFLRINRENATLEEKRNFLAEIT